jgi:hypothetical protein
MKTHLYLGLALLAAAPASAQVFRPATVNGAVIGGIAGAVIGNNSGSLNHNAWKGAAIGAGVGALIGSAVGHDNDNRRNTQVRSPRHDSPYIYRSAPPVVYRAHGHGGYYGGGYYGSGGYYSSGGYSGSSYYRGSAARDGLVLGALAGGIIGHNSGSFRHNGWRGAAWGAGVGWVLGSIADANRPVIWERPPVYVEQAQPVVVQTPAPAAQPAAAPQQVTIINNYYGNAAPMSQANGLFGR